MNCSCGSLDCTPRSPMKSHAVPNKGISSFSAPWAGSSRRLSHESYRWFGHRRARTPVLACNRHRYEFFPVLEAHVLGCVQAHMGRLFNNIRSAVQEDRFLVSWHADEQCEERAVSVWQKVAGFQDAQLVRRAVSEQAQPIGDRTLDATRTRNPGTLASGVEPNRWEQMLQLGVWHRLLPKTPRKSVVGEDS